MSRTSRTSRTSRISRPPGVFRAVLALALLLAAPLGAQPMSTAGASDVGAIAGRVVAPRTRAPLENVMVVVQGTPRGALTDAHGQFMIAGVPAGAHVVVARRVGLAEASRTVQVSGGATARVDFELGEQATVVAPVVVSATRETQRRTENSATVDVLDGAEVRLSRAAHPAQIMKRVPGVYVSQLSAEGSSVAIRQPITTAPVYLYLEDGIPTRATGFFNHNALYEVNIPQSGGIEVLKGPGTSLYGSDAIGGVVNVLTRPAPPTPSAEATVEGGAFGYMRLLATGGFTSGRNGLRTDLNVTDVQGWRERSPYTRQSATVRWDHFGAGGLTAKTVVTGSRIDQNDALPLGQLLFDERSSLNRSPLAYRRARALRASTAIEKSVGPSLWSVTPYARYNAMELLPSWQLTYDPQTWDTRNTSVGVLARWRRDFEPMRARLIVGADADWSPGSFVARRAELTRAGSGAATVFESYTTGATHYDYDVTYQALSPYVHTELSPVARLRLDAGVRLDASRYAYRTRLAPTDTGAHRVPAGTTRDYRRASPKLGATYTLSPGAALFAAYRTGFRAPSQGQLFQQNTAANTVDLAPVTVASWEGGVRGQLGRRLLYQLSAYDMSVRDDILTFVTEQNTREATNAGRTRHRGVEGSVGVALLPTLKLDLAYSVSDQRYVRWTPQAARPAQGTTPARAAVSYDGNRVAQAPRTLGNVLLTYTPRLLHGGRVAAELSTAGRYAMDPENTHEYDGHALLQLHANHVVRPGLELFARVMNVADVRHAEVATFDAFQREQYTPGAPRTVYAGLKYGWGK
jgi:iron complex outermembrane receptor protein